jgi:hypothetical protein
MVPSISMIRSLASTCASRNVPRSDRRLQLGLAQPQHPAQLFGADLLVQHGAHLVEGEAEIFQRDDAVEPRKLAGLIEPVAAGRVDPSREEQPGRVVMTQHADRHPTVPGEVSDGEHDASNSTA